MNTGSQSFLREIAGGRYGFVPEHVQQELANKIGAGCAVGILDAPDPAFKSLAFRYGPQNHAEGKKENKRVLQKRLRLIQNDRAPLLFWPCPLEPVYQGCQLLADILYEVVAKYWTEELQIVLVLLIIAVLTSTASPFANTMSDSRIWLMRQRTLY